MFISSQLALYYLHLAVFCVSCGYTNQTSGLALPYWPNTRPKGGLLLHVALVIGPVIDLAIYENIGDRGYNIKA